MSNRSMLRNLENENYKPTFDDCWSNKQKSNPNISTNNFKALYKLGRGAFSFAYVVKWYYSENNRHDNILCVLKVTGKQQLMRKRAHLFAFRERDILQCCQHPNIVQLFSSFKDESNLYLVLEFIHGGDLFSFMQLYERLDEKHARFYVGQIVLALEYLHRHHVIYRDLKPENIILTKCGYLKLIDFGLAKRTVQTTSTMCGTPHFMSPEVILHRSYNSSVDYWALGILTYEMLTGDTPFNGKNDEEVFDAILNGPICFDLAVFTRTAANFIQRLLTRNPVRRLGCLIGKSSSVRYHEWFQQDSYSFEQLEQQTVTAFYVPSKLIDHTDYPLKSIQVVPLTCPVDEKLFDKF